MKRGFHRAFLAVLSILLLSCIVFSASSAQPKKYSWQLDTSPFKFDLYFYGAWGSFYRWTGTLVEKWITEATGVTPNIIVPTGDEKEYLSVMVASGNLPDAMVLEWYSPDTKKIIEAGLVYSINELCEKYAPDFWDMIPQEIKNYHKQKDGKLYYIPSFFPSKEEWALSLEKHNARPLFIQRGIYEALGKPKINTPEDLLRVLKEIKKRYPKIIPFAIEPPISVDQWGLTGSDTLRFFAGIFAPETYARDVYLEKGKLKFLFENLNFVEAVRFLNRIYREGYITSDLLMMKHEIYGELVDSAQAAIVARFPIDIWKAHNPKIIKLTRDEKKTYMPLVPYFSYKNKKPQFSGTRGPGWVGSMVTKNAKNPARIIRYFQYSWSDEGQLTNLFGKEGVTYRMVDGSPRYLPEVFKELQEKPETLDLKYGFERRLLMWRSRWAVEQRVAIAPKEFEDYLKAVAPYAVDTWDLGLDNLDPDPVSPEGVAYARIKLIWNKYLARMVLAKDAREFSSAYQDALKEIKDAGLEKVRAVMYQNHLKDLAKKRG